MNFSDMTVGLRVKSVKPSVYYPDISLDVPIGTTGIVDRIQPKEIDDLACVIVKLDEPIVHDDPHYEPFSELWIYDTDPDDRDWMSPDDFEPISPMTDEMILAAIGKPVRLVRDVDGMWLDEAIKAGITGKIAAAEPWMDVVAVFVPDQPIEILEEWGGTLQIHHSGADGDCRSEHFEPI